MDCRELKDSINAFVDGEASAEEARTVESHLAGCPACRDTLKRMRALNVGMDSVQTTVPADFRERLFARMENECLLPARRGRFAFSFRWATVPVAAAAALALFLLVARERTPVVPTVPGDDLRVMRPAAEATGPLPGGGAGRDLTPEERDIVANLDLLENLPLLEGSGGIDELEMSGKPDPKRG